MSALKVGLRFFKRKKKPMEQEKKEEVTPEANVPVEETAATAVNPPADQPLPEEPAKQEAAEAAPEAPVEKVQEDTVISGTPEVDLPLKHGQVDPTYNCSNCGGDGLIGPAGKEISCPQCQGRGKLG